MSDEQAFLWLRNMHIEWMNEGHSFGLFEEETYMWVITKLMEANELKDLESLLPQIVFAANEKKYNALLGRMAKGREMIASEADSARKEKLRSHYKKLEKELEVMARKWTR